MLMLMLFESSVLEEYFRNAEAGVPVAIAPPNLNSPCM